MTLSIIAGEDFYREVYEKGLRDHFMYLSQGHFHTSQEVDLVYRIDGEVVGVAGIWPNPYNKNVLWLPFLSVREEFRHRGIGTALAKAAAEYAKARGKILKVSTYSEEGMLYLKRVFERLKGEYRIIDEES